MHTSEFLNISASIVPERTAVVFENRKLSFEQLQENVNRLANGLSNIGINAGDRIAIVDVNTPELIETYLATTQLDAIFVPLNYRAKAEELSYMLLTCEPSAILVGSRYQGLVDSVVCSKGIDAHMIAIANPRKSWYLYSQLLDESSQIAPPAPSGTDSDITLLLFTAGTTGRPKAVMLNHDSFSSYMLSSVPPADPDNEERNILSMPLYHIAGMQGALASIFGGRTLLLMRQFDPEAWMRLAQNEQADRSGLVPTMIKQILDHPNFSSYDLSSLKVITYGAAPMPINVIKRAIAEFPNAQFINAFGQTETASTITMLSPEDHMLIGTPHEIKIKLRRLTSVGKPLDDIEVAVLDENGAQLPPGTIGEVAARGPRVMTGYWNDSKATRSIFRDGWLITGDLGYQDKDGYLYLSGRSKDFIKRGGEMISPEEIEQTIIEHPSVDEAAVIGIADPQWGERVRAVVALKEGLSCVESELIKHCHQRLASFKRPESVVFVQQLPRNPLGKVLKRVLREQYGYPIDS
ncbi:long-chain fatty acid--CoA ligase [SAR202 cluster bacterium AD-804-J14_MRT_500m]|nr:long-chain fatty acid--CoA ligase [SAR202 cluster bacterium AD-804-J14_MRT_500m]